MSSTATELTLEEYEEIVAAQEDTIHFLAVALSRIAGASPTAFVSGPVGTKPNNLAIVKAFEHQKELAKQTLKKLNGDDDERVA